MPLCLESRLSNRHTRSGVNVAIFNAGSAFQERIRKYAVHINALIVVGRLRNSLWGVTQGRSDSFVDISNLDDIPRIAEKTNVVWNAYLGDLGLFSKLIPKLSYNSYSSSWLSVSTGT